MAGSFNHIVDDDGSFKMTTIENMGDAHEALEECYAIVSYLVGGDIAVLNVVLDRLNFPTVKNKGQRLTTLMKRTTPRVISIPRMPFAFGDGRFRMLYGPANASGGREVAGVIREDYVSQLEDILEKDIR